MKINLQHIEAGIRYFLTEGNEELTPGEKFVLILTSRLLEQFQVVSKQEVCENNQAKPATTYGFLKSLEHKGFIRSTRSNQYYSKSYLSLTEKGLLFKSKLAKFILG
jgi:DNA-binding MarR family transcriptional regulator